MTDKPARAIASVHVDNDRMVASTFDWQTGLTEYAVTNMLDEDGEETEHPAEACVIVVKFSDNEWGAFDIRKFIRLEAN